MAHAAMLERLLGRLSGPGADLEDLLQATFEAAILAFPRFRGEASVATWLTRIAVRTALHAHRRSRRRATLALVRAERPEPGTPPDDQADARRKLERLHHHLQGIGVKKRIAFLLHVVEGRSMEEVAALMGASRAATKSRVFWARRELLAAICRDPLLEAGGEAGEP
jgi:RNA polymerase sigma-70 factor (ECF subfamily)